MKRTSCLASLLSLLMLGVAGASPSDADRVMKTYQLSVQKWSLEVGSAATDADRIKALESRPDATGFAKEMWGIIGHSLSEEWVLEPAAWFLGLASGLRTTLSNGGSSPAFTEEIAAIQHAIASDHMKSTKLAPVCLALSAGDDPQSLVLLEKIESSHSDKVIQGVAALAIAIRLKSVGDEPELMSKRLVLLRKAIIESAHVEINGLSVAKLAEDELYIIRFLTKGRVAPDLSGVDSGGRPMKLADYAGKVVVLLFWNSAAHDNDRVLEMAGEMSRKFAGKPFVVIGVNNDTTANLRNLQAKPDIVNFPNFSDPQNRIAREYRIDNWPLAYVLDGDRKIQYSGPPGSFVELTASALLDDSKPATGK